MKFAEEIKRTKEFQQHLNLIDQVAENMKKDTISKYNEKPCNHDIIIKFYESSYDESCEKPTYQCLCCEEIIYDDMELAGKNIINFTMNEAGKIIVEGQRPLTSYLQYLTKQTQSNNPNYTDEDFVNFLHNQAAKIKVPKGFKPSDVKW